MFKRTFVSLVVVVALLGWMRAAPVGQKPASLSRDLLVHLSAPHSHRVYVVWGSSNRR